MQQLRMLRRGSGSLAAAAAVRALPVAAPPPPAAPPAPAAPSAGLQHIQAGFHRRRSSTSSRSSTPTPAAAGAAGGAAAGDTADPAALRSSLLARMQGRFCRMCGAPLSVVQPEGDKEWRSVCTSCNYIDYHNPRMVVGCVVTHEGQILLARRGIEPCKGMWGLPAGFLELGESTAAGAVRETLEEANAAVTLLGPYAHWDIPVIGQAYILFRAQLAPPFTFSPGHETTEVQLFAPDSIPWDSLAFSSVTITLRNVVEDMASGTWHVHHGVIHREPDAAPNAPGAYRLADHHKMRCSA